jgi:hypothetical protein
VTGKRPELWYAEDGRSEPVSFKIADGRTHIPLKFEPWGTVFVVFRDSTQETSRTLLEPTETVVQTLEGPWTVSFQPGRGAPASIPMLRLESWTNNADIGVKYFSGIGTYTRTFRLKAGQFRRRGRIWIDLGEVRNLAEVAVNGKPLGIAWHKPYRVEVTSALKHGANALTIKVVNAWVNRLIGDQRPGVDTPITFTDVKPYTADSPLLESGLLGPVSVQSIVRGKVSRSVPVDDRHSGQLESSTSH